MSFVGSSAAVPGAIIANDAVKRHEPLSLLHPSTALASVFTDSVSHLRRSGFQRGTHSRVHSALEHAMGLSTTRG